MDSIVNDTNIKLLITQKRKTSDKVGKKMKKERYKIIWGIGTTQIVDTKREAMQIAADLLKSNESISIVKVK